MENWDDYRLLLALDRGRTLRHAAKMLGVSHSTVSRRLQQINQKRGTVFEPVAGGLRPTEFGKGVLNFAVRMEAIAFEAESFSAVKPDDLSGSITLSLPSIVAEHLLLDELAEFTRDHPNISLNLDTESAYADLDSAGADIVIRCTDKPLDHLHGRRLSLDAFSFYAAPSYLQKPSSEWRWLAGVPENDTLSWLVRSPLPEAPVGLRIKNMTARFQAAIFGHGLLFAPCFMGDAHEGLVRLPDARLITDREFWVLTHPDSKDVPRMVALRQFLASAMKKKAALIEGRQVKAA